jgi:RNA polymerase sigma-70 factor (ECF subfamily)
LGIALTRRPELAEDIVQDTFLRFAQNLETFRLTGNLKAYLSVCAVNQARNLLRQTSRRKAVGLENACHVSAIEQGPLTKAIGNEQLVRLSWALGEIPIDQRVVIALHLHADMRFTDISRHLNLSVDTVKSRYRYGIDKLRSLLNGKGHYETVG